MNLKCFPFYCFNIDISVTIYTADLHFSVPLPDVLYKGSVSQIFKNTIIKKSASHLSTH